MKEDWIWTDHIKHQMLERKIDANTVERALLSPDGIVSGTENRLVYQKIEDGKLIRVVTEQDRLITVYLTEKINKYLKRSKS